jgi:hypothetical protein
MKPTNTGSYVCDTWMVNDIAGNLYKRWNILVQSFLGQSLEKPEWGDHVAGEERRRWAAVHYHTSDPRVQWQCIYSAKI